MVRRRAARFGGTGAAPEFSIGVSTEVLGPSDGPGLADGISAGGEEPRDSGGGGGGGGFMEGAGGAVSDAPALDGGMEGVGGATGEGAAEGAPGAVVDGAAPTEVLDGPPWGDPAW